ncbi:MULTISPECIES: hypothetical protein [unclassified Saccharicrinis]|uniref:hypothetical protein n=1 Tax=unclassified Saccharicrinis TaxID=2646859 RepID=UPI003D344231
MEVSSHGYQLNDIIKRMENNNYSVFKNDRKPYNLNLIGIRTTSRIANAFDDFVGYFYHFRGKWTFKLYPATTDPGQYWLDKPMMLAGTAILKAGQYRQAYTIGLHAGKYRALRQAAPVTVYRDPNRDNMLDHDVQESTGMFGINIHRASAYQPSVKVFKWSAGCQVIAAPKDFQEFMDVCTKASRQWGSKFTYTLLED